MDNNLTDKIKANKDGRFFRLNDKIPYKDCYLHKEKKQTRQGRWGVKMVGQITGAVRFLYLCDDCLHRTVYIDGDTIRFDPTRN